MIDIRARLLEMAEPSNADFLFRLTPGLRREDLLGVRTPALRSLARELRGTPEAAEFLQALPHRYLDENLLHVLLLNDVRDFDACLAEVDAFLPYMDNWAVCDALSPTCFKKNAAALLPSVRRWLGEGHPYTRRFAVGALMRWFLTEHFQPEYLDWAAGQCCNEYYVNMMVAWYFATALAKQLPAALPYVQTEGRLSPWVRRKTIQKALESDRINAEQKETLREIRKTL